MNTTRAYEQFTVSRNKFRIVSPLLGAVLLGAVIIFASGFSNIGIVHNAAHDMRHGNAFPCH